MRGILNATVSALMPVFFGIVMAFLVNPLVNRIEDWLKKKQLLGRYRRGVAIAAGTAAYGILLYAIIALLVPQLWYSIMGLINELPGMLQRAVLWLEEKMEQNDWLKQAVDNLWRQVNSRFNVWVEQELMSTLQSLANGVYNAAALVYSTAKVIFNLVIGLIVMIYLLIAKDDFVGQGKKLLYAFCKNRKVAAAILEVGREARHIFQGFITGKLLDSLIVGILCLICLNLLKMPYAVLVSVIVGVTNVIPVFGPFIGAIPSAFLILLVDPMKCLIFIVFILILQQVDGNIIGPKILGDSTGLSAFWVMFAILLFGKLMGVVGMLLGVPLFATLYYIVKRVSETLLRRQELPTDTDEYVEIDYIDEENQPHFLNGVRPKGSMRQRGKKRKSEKKHKSGEKKDR